MAQAKQEELSQSVQSQVKIQAIPRETTEEAFRQMGILCHSTQDILQVLKLKCWRKGKYALRGKLTFKSSGFS